MPFSRVGPTIVVLLRPVSRRSGRGGIRGRPACGRAADAGTLRAVCRQEFREPRLDPQVVTKFVPSLVVADGR